MRFGGMPQEMFIFKGSEMPLPSICKEQGNSLINQNKEERWVISKLFCLYVNVWDNL